ncbi:hypothetical protein [Piscinibacter sp. XHJ-5]|uniref:hypothetical protein n=1 Tax=Piscinibacter sp. XHJ-5 TaxID=3037797 RepID=UPI002452D0BE|nr:hypothetical protein [Piscinibacter sp. XHJ-5]
MASPAPADSFFDRARQLVLFLAESPRPPVATRSVEHDVADWIARWQKLPSQGWSRAQHFVGDELGIIIRALSGPHAGPARRSDERNEQLCWLLARCMAEAA